MRIDRLATGKTIIRISGAELLREGLDFSSLELRNGTALQILRRAVDAAYGDGSSKVLLEAFPEPDGGVTLLATPFRESMRILALRFSDAGAASAVIEELYKKYNISSVIQNGELTLLLRLRCGEAVPSELRLSEFCDCEYISNVRAAYLTERYGQSRR